MSTGNARNHFHLLFSVAAGNKNMTNEDDEEIELREELDGQKQK